MTNKSAAFHAPDYRRKWLKHTPPTQSSLASCSGPLPASGGSYVLSFNKPLICVRSPSIVHELHSWHSRDKELCVNQELSATEIIELLAPISQEDSVFTGSPIS
jgi:hypothetical protein